MKTIKIIDLLNKIANGEKVPKKIKYDTMNYYFRNYDYKEVHGKLIDEQTSFIEKIDFYKLNDEVEIIEDRCECIDEEVEKLFKEEKEIEKLDVALLGQCDNWLRCPTNKVTKQDVELNPYIIDNIRENTLYFQRKINELIDAVNEMRKEK